ncbi:MAG: hypothetical protein COA40_09920 [Aequorivita sp.]|nr:MAG: hypothetical protein COA40_09920 [Aequorivita sp.]
MKKILLFTAIAMLAFTSSQAQDFRFGAKAGVNFASLNGDDADDLDGRTSFHIGAVARIQFSELLALQPEIIFSNQGYTVDIGESEDVTGRLGYINLPILVDVTLADGLSLQGGPQVGFNITADQEFDGETEDFPDDTVQTVEFGVGLGAQYILPMNLFFQARYVIGVTDVIEDVNAKNSVISLSVGYFFN